MADDVTTQSGTLASVPAGGVYAFDLINGVLYARSKTGWGADGSYVDVSAANPLPVVQTGTPTLPTGAATAANQTTLIGHVDGIETLLAAVATLAEQQSQTTQLTAASASLSVMDDWDETDRAKVNPIVGQAGLQGGSGAVSANTLRTVLATDVALPAGSNAIGAVTPRFTRTLLTATATVSTSPAYTAGDAVGGLLTLPSAARVSGGTIVIEAIVVIDKSKQAPALIAQFFDRSVTVASDNAAADYSDADMLFGLPPVQLSNWETYGSNSVCGRVVNMPWKLNGTDLYLQFVTRGTPTFAGTSDIVVGVLVAQD